MARVFSQLFLVITHVVVTDAALSNQFQQMGLNLQDPAPAGRARLPLRARANASTDTAAFSAVQTGSSGSLIVSNAASLDSEHMVAAVTSLLALLAPIIIVMAIVGVLIVRMVLRGLRSRNEEEQTLKDEAFQLLKPDRHAPPSPFTIIKCVLLLLFSSMILYGGLEWIRFVASGPFARRFTCTDTERDAPSADLTPMVQHALRGFCWEGYRWVGVNRGEAELLLLGLERSLIETSASGERGDVVELGAALGETTLWVSRFLDLYAKATGEPRRGHRVYDAFEGAGFPPCDGSKDGDTCKRWWMRSDLFRGTMNFFLADRRWLLRFLLRSQGATQPDLIQKGFFSNNPPEVYPDKVAFAMFDSDMYESILDSFKQVYPRMSAAGLAFTHDVDRSCCGGPRLAASKYLGDGSHQPAGFFTWEGKRPFVTWAVTGPAMCAASDGACKAPYPGEGWKWNVAKND